MRGRARHRLALAAVVSALWAPTAALAQDGGPVHLRLHLEAGMTWRESGTQELRTMSEIGGGSSESLQVTETVTLFEVLSVDEEGRGRVRSTIERVRIIFDGPMGRTEYDSADPDSIVPEMARPAASMVGSITRMTMAPDGSVQDYEGWEDMYEGMMDEVPSLVDSLEDMGFRDALPFSDPSVATEMMEQAPSRYPPGPLSVGESWSDTVHIDVMVPSTRSQTSTLVARRDGISYLEFTGASTQVGTMEFGPTSSHMDLSGTWTGSAEIDEATGLMLLYRTEETSAGTVTMTDTTMGTMSMPMRTTTIITTRIVPGG